MASSQAVLNSSDSESPTARDRLSMLTLPPLNDLERKHLQAVLQRADDLQRQEEWRKVKLRTSSNINIVSETFSQSPEKGKQASKCTACGASLMWLINPALSCDRCQESTCKNCTKLFDGGYRQFCSFCFLDLKYRLESGDWFISTRRRANRTQKFAIEELRDALTSPRGYLKNDNRKSPKISPVAKRTRDDRKSSVPSIIINECEKGESANDEAIRQKRSTNFHRKILERDYHDSRSDYSDDSSHLGSASISHSHQLTEKLKPKHILPIVYEEDTEEIEYRHAEPCQVDEATTKSKNEIVEVVEVISQVDYLSDNGTLDSHPQHPDESISDLLIEPPQKRPLASQESLVSLYSLADENFDLPFDMATGDVQLSIEYDNRKGKLLINVRQCRQLLPQSKTKRSSDPYVKMYLLPDKTRLAKRKTSTKKATLNPVYNETFKYNVESGDVYTRCLWVTVWHGIRLGHNIFLGEATIPLTDVDLSDPAPQWYSLHEKRDIDVPSSHLIYKGDLCMAVKHIATNDILIVNERQVDSKGELHVWIKDAKNLIPAHSNGYSNPFAKVVLLPDKSKKSKKKTDVIRKTLCPSWNTVLRFENVSAADLKERSLEITVWDHSRVRGNEFLGGVRLNLGKGKHNGDEVKWMNAAGYEVTLWRSVIQKPSTWVEGCLSLRANMD